VPREKPKTENVEFFSSPKDAVFAGYRPCLKCKPVAGDDEPAWVARLISRIEQKPQARIREQDLKRWACIRSECGATSRRGTA
jgi:AraC family transcriptional regulator of adaptative response/methylated-DNA-[protein]-cysteine methyltransferase